MRYQRLQSELKRKGKKSQKSTQQSAVLFIINDLRECFLQFGNAEM